MTYAHASVCPENSEDVLEVMVVSNDLANSSSFDFANSTPVREKSMKRWRELPATIVGYEERHILADDECTCDMQFEGNR